MADIAPIYLTLLMGPMIPVPVPLELTDALLSAQVTVTAGQRSGFQLGFDLAKTGLINTVLLPAGFFDPQIRVVIVVTVNGTPSVLMDGVIIRQEVALSNAAGQSTLTITGEDLTALMDLEEKPDIPFPAIPAPARIEAIVAGYLQYGIVPLVIPQIFPDVVLPTERIEFQKGTDLAYINQLAKANGYVFYLDPGPLPGMSRAYWGPEIRIGIPQPALTVNSDAFSNVQQLTFSFDGTAREQPTVRIQIPSTMLAIEIPVPDISVLRPPLAVRPALAMKKTVLPDTAKQDPAQAATEALAIAAQSADAITGSGQLDVLRYGQVLRPRELVGVRGAGITYDGLFYVKSVTHNLKRGAYTQNFTLAREGLISLTPIVAP
jgi:hypothetical protein